MCLKIHILDVNEVYFVDIYIYHGKICKVYLINTQDCAVPGMMLPFKAMYIYIYMVIKTVLVLVPRVDSDK